MASNTAIILVDPLNDFLHPDGKLNNLVRESLQVTDTVQHMKDLVKVARSAHIPIYYGLHQPYRIGNYDGWQHMTKSHHRNKQLNVFEEGSWGAQITEGLEPKLENGDVVVSKHWNSSSFANTDLDYQLRQRGITRLVLAGMVTNTCLESTARYALELGYHITLLTDATAGFTTAQKNAAVEHIWPIIAQEVTTVESWADTWSKTNGKI